MEKESITFGGIKMKLTEKKLRRIIKEEMLNEFMGFGKKQPKRGMIR